MHSTLSFEEILFKKYLSDSLAGVYLVKYHSLEDFSAWHEKFTHLLTPIANHPDIIWIERDMKDKTERENEYKVDSKAILSLIQTIDFLPVSLKQKIIFIKDAHLISELTSNKLLKTFEELPNFVTIFLCAPHDENLLQTVESRSININLPQNKKQIPLNWDEFESLNEVINHLKKSEDEYALTKEFIDSEISKSLLNSDYSKISQLLDNLKHFDQSQRYNNLKSAGLSLITRKK